MSRNGDLGPVGTTLAILFVVLVIAAQCWASNRCENAHGTYLWREAKCIDVRTIRP